MKEFGKTSREHADWKAPESVPDGDGSESRQIDDSTDRAKLDPSLEIPVSFVDHGEAEEGNTESAKPPEAGLETVRPTPENPIKEIRIGLWHTLGQVHFPTRAVIILEDGREASIPWKEAEELLPPEYKTARKLGERARKLQRESSNLENAIRGGTDIMKRSGHLKDSALELLGRKRPTLAFFEQVGILHKRLEEVGQECFYELRRMTNLRASRQSEIDELARQIDEIELELTTVRTEIFEKIPTVKLEYERVYMPRPKVIEKGKERLTLTEGDDEKRSS